MKGKRKKVQHVKPNWREQQVNAMREGRRQRAATFKSKKGRGSYRRRNKHGGHD